MLVKLSSREIREILSFQHEQLQKINSMRKFQGKAMIQGIQLTLHCILLNSRSFQKRFICSGLSSECAHLEAGEPYCIVPPPFFYLSLP